jgi:hypothetical protein
MCLILYKKLIRDCFDGLSALERREQLQAMPGWVGFPVKR